MDGAFLILLVTLLSALVTFVVVRPVTRAAERRQILDRPGGHKGHDRPTPLLGGVAVAIGWAAGFVPFVPLLADGDLAGLGALVVGAAIIIGGGLWDDVHGLNPRHKLAWQVAAAAVAGICLALLGIRLQLFLPWPSLPIVLLTALWVVSITNALNFLDNMNGLCAGLGAIAAMTLAVINLRSLEPAVAVTAAALAGACLGFLPYNWPRARIFLGDTGSMTIGFLLAALSVMGVYTRGADLPWLAVFTPLLVLALPLMDLSIVVVLRWRDGRPFWLADRSHLSHRLVQRGMQPATAVATIWAASAAAGIAAVLLPTVGAVQAPLLLLLVALALGAVAGAAGTRGL